MYISVRLFSSRDNSIKTLVILLSIYFGISSINWYHSTTILVTLMVVTRSEMEARMQVLERGFEALIVMKEVWEHGSAKDFKGLGTLPFQIPL